VIVNGWAAGVRRLTRFRGKSRLKQKEFGWNCRLRVREVKNWLSGSLLGCETRLAEGGWVAIQKTSGAVKQLGDIL
jgi:hypothetical protein